MIVLRPKIYNYQFSTHVFAQGKIHLAAGLAPLRLTSITFKYEKKILLNTLIFVLLTWNIDVI